MKISERNTKKNRYTDFTHANQELWSRVPDTNVINGLLLVEPQYHPIISHANGVFARIIKEARGLEIGWIDTGNPAIQVRLHSYDSTSRTIPLKKFDLFRKLIVGFRFVKSALRMLFTGNILGFSIGDARLGDILYDTYLNSYRVATVPGVNIGILRTLLELTKNYYQYRNIIKDYGASAVLVSHDVGISSGVLLRVALQLGLNVFHRSSCTPTVQFYLHKTLSDIYNVYRPRSIDMRILLSMDSTIIENKFRELMEERMHRHSDIDAEKAYCKKKNIYFTKQGFADKFNISADRKFVFVMLHAFNDHPHSHFGKMLFGDYYDWFVQTLAFARTKSNVNWIFKEHPSAVFYPTRDISLPNHFTESSDHIVFLDTDSSFNSASLLYLADAVVTVTGTAGVEFAAAGGIPSVLAGATSYSGFGFTLDPKTKPEYFQALANIENINRLTKSQQDTAKRVFLYTQHYSYVPFSWSPLVSYKETKNSNLDSDYWASIPAYYAQNSAILLNEFDKYSNSISQKNFSRLTQLQFFAEQTEKK